MEEIRSAFHKELLFPCYTCTLCLLIGAVKCFILLFCVLIMNIFVPISLSSGKIFIPITGEISILGDLTCIHCVCHLSC